MQYIIYDLGELKKDSVVEVRLSAPTNVRLIDKVNLDMMKNEDKHIYYGGFVSSSPYRVMVPKTRHWFVLIDLVGTIKHSVNVLPPRLPDAN